MNDQDKQQLPGKLRQPPGWLAPAVVVLLTGTFLLLSGSAVSSKSSTIDEPLHTLGAWLIKHRSDYRLNREDPPLWQHWAGLALPAGGFRANVSEELWQSTRRGVLNNQSYVVDTMSRTPGNDGEAMVQRARGLMLVLGAVLVAVTFGWARAAGGAVAGALAGALVAMDPNFLSHAALMKNDVPFTLLVAATLWTVWLCGRGITPLRCAALLIVPALAVATKFSGLVLPSVVLILLLLRAMLPTPWSIFGRQIHSRATRAATVLALFAGVCLTCVAVVWASYGFRFAPTPDPSIEFNILGLKGVVAEREIQARNGNFRPTPAELSAWKPGPMVAAALFANDHKLLPQTFLAGLLYTHASTQVRDSYLMGQFSATGWWYYFPVAMVIKTPLPTLAAMTLSACWGILLLRRSRPSPEFIWTAICPLVFILIYLALAVRTNLNIGMRHMLPIYPPMAVLCGLAAAQGWSLGRRWLRAGIVVLPVLLAIVAVRAWPNYIPYMNALAGDDVGRLHWLGDSNLDWGQDLQTLAQWRATHPEGVLYFCYFGNVDPERYEIAYEPIVGTLHPRDREVLAYARMTQTGYVAVSASQLQGIYLPPADRAFFRRLLRTPPVAVIGGSIFVWRWPGMPSTD